MAPKVDRRVPPEIRLAAAIVIGWGMALTLYTLM